MSRYETVAVHPPQDSETFVRVPLTGLDAPGVTSCCGEGCFRRPEVEFLTSRWSVFLKDHIPQAVFEAMMEDVYGGPKFQKFLTTYYSPAGSLGGLMCCMPCAVPFLLSSHSGMKAEVSRKLSAWNRVLCGHNCGVTMQINEHGLVFNILPSATLFKAHDDEKARDECARQLLLDLGLRQIDR